MDFVTGVLKKTRNYYSQRSLWQRRAVFGVVGAVAGFTYYHYVGCTTGTCPITGNPYLSTVYGSLMGMLLPVRKKSADISPGSDLL